MGIINENHTIVGYLAHDVILKKTNKDDDFIKRYQSIPFILYGKKAENFVKNVVRGQQVLVQFKIVTRKPKENEFLNPILMVSRFETLESPEIARARNPERKDDEEIPEQELNNEVEKMAEEQAYHQKIDEYEFY